MKTTLCVTCNTEINNKGLKNHLKACNGSGPKSRFIKLSICPHCDADLSQFITANRANHVRWCNNNPKRLEYVNNSNCSQMNTPESISKRTAGIQQAWADGKYDSVINIGSTGYKHTDKTKEILRQKALLSPHRRLVRSIRDYITKDGTIVKLDSSWEEALAIRLDEIDVKWIRPGPIKWFDVDGKSHHYFPDFYLPYFDLYLDPKGPYAFKAQIAKINCLIKQIKNLVIITSLEDCQNFNPKK
jgi:hypothetical protein